jgi:hypothetical protein
MNLAEAITAVETTQTAYQNAVTQTTNDQAAAAAVQAKLDAANTLVTTDVAAQSSAAATFNASIDALIATATAAKVPIPTDSVSTGS